MYDSSIINTQIVLPDKMIYGNVNIREGKIESIIESENQDDSIIGKAENIIDGEGMYLLPGMIDSHVHIRGGVFSHREDFKTGTAAAAAGGITTIFEMPVCNPPSSTEANFVKKQREVANDAYIDYCLYGGAGIDNLEEIPKMAKAGAVGFKTFLMPPVKFREKEFYGLCSETEQDLIDVMQVVESTKLPLVIHAELNEYINKLEEELKLEGKNELLDFYKSRPKIAEIEAVKRVIRCSEITNCKSLICHISSIEAIELIKDAQARGVNVYGETCPQYLLFSDEFAAGSGVFGRIKPPLRSQDNVDKLMEMYKEGAFDATGSDHAPYTYEEKTKNGDSIWETVDGIPGLELSLPLMLNQVIDGKINLIELSNCLSTKTAKTFGIDKYKGSIEVGKDADLVLVKKLDNPKKIKSKSLLTKSRDTAKLYEDILLKFDICKTFVRGEEIFSDRYILGEPGFGRWIKPNIIR